MNPALTTQAGTQSLENQAYRNGQNRTQMINNQSGFDQQVYGNSVANANEQNNIANQQRTQANNSYGNLLNYTRSLPSYRTMFGNYFNQGSNQLGYNAKTTQEAANNLTATENIASNLPQAAQQASNYSGATAGQITQDYQNMAGAINPALANANNAMKNQLGMYNAAQQYATGASNTAITGEQNKIGAYNDLLTGANTTYGNAVSQYQAATAQMQAAGQTMASIMQTASQRGYYNAQQIAAIQNAHNSYVTAQAARTTAAAQAEVAPSTVAANMAAAAQQRQSVVQSFLHSNPTSTAQNMANALGIPLNEAGAYLTSMRQNNPKTASKKNTSNPSRPATPNIFNSIGYGLAPTNTSLGSMF